MEDGVPMPSASDHRASDPAGGNTASAYLLDLKLRNIRCFGPEEQTLRLSDGQGRPAPWTVILGDNGVGKTTLLQCLVALEPRRYFLKSVGPEERPWVELPTDRGDGWRIYRDPSRPWETALRGRVGVGSGRALAEDRFEALEVVVPTSSGTSPSLLVASADERPQNLRCCSYGAPRRMGSAALSRGPED